MQTTISQRQELRDAARRWEETPKDEYRSVDDQRNDALRAITGIVTGVLISVAFYALAYIAFFGDRL